MPLPDDSVTHGTHGGDTGSHTDGTFLFNGSKTDLAMAGGAMGLRITCVNIFGKKHEGSLAYCIEKVVTLADGSVTMAHTWKTPQQYESGHQQLWRTFDMEPNRKFKVENEERWANTWMGRTSFASATGGLRRLRSRPSVLERRGRYTASQPEFHYLFSIPSSLFLSGSSFI